MALYDCPNDAAITAGLSTIAPGDIFDLYPGNSFGRFTIPSFSNGSPVIFRAKNTAFIENVRISNQTLPRIVMNDTADGKVGPWMQGTGTVHWEGIEFTNSYTSDPGSQDLCSGGNIITPITSVAGLPANLSWKWCRFDGGANIFQLRAIDLKCNNATIHNCHFLRIAKSGAEPKAIAGVGSYGIIDIRNNFFDRCSCTALMHGAGISLPSNTLSEQFIFEQNYVYWPTDWTAAGGKSHIELKGWRYPRIVGNIFQNHWTVGQPDTFNFSDYMQAEGYGIQHGKGIVFAFNKVLNCTERLIGISDSPGSGVVPLFTDSITILHNLMIGGRDPRNGNPASNALFPMYCKGIRMENNTILADQNVSINGSVYCVGPGRMLGARINRNILPCPSTGNGNWLTVTDGGFGQNGLNAGAGTGNWQCTGNFFGGTEFESNGPAAGNTWLASNAALAAALDSNYRILPGGAMGGQNVGANIDLLEAATFGVIEGRPGPRIKYDYFGGYRS